MSTLNISATQELLKRIEVLEKTNQTLTAQVNELENLKAEVEQIKELLQLKAAIKE